jgi:hypothetical protein
MGWDGMGHPRPSLPSPPLPSPAQNPKIGLNLDHFDRIFKQAIILVKTLFFKIKHKTLMEDYKFFQFFIMNRVLEKPPAAELIPCRPKSLRRMCLLRDSAQTQV